MNFRQSWHLSKDKKSNLSNSPKNNFIKNNISIKDIEILFNKNKISNNNSIKLKELILKTNKKNLHENNFLKKIQKQNSFHIKAPEQRIRFKSAYPDKKNNFVKMNSNINLNPKILFKNEKMKFPLLKEKSITKNDNIKIKIRPLSDYHSKMEEKNNKSIKLKFLLKNHTNINIFKLKKNENKITKKLLKNENEKLKKQQKEEEDRIKKEKEEEEERIKKEKEEEEKRRKKEEEKKRKKEEKKGRKEFEEKMRKKEEEKKIKKEKEEEEKKRKEEEERRRKKEEKKRRNELAERRRKELEEEKKRRKELEEEEEKRRKELEEEEEKRRKELEEKRRKKEEEKKRKEEEKRKKEEEAFKMKFEKEEKGKKEIKKEDVEEIQVCKDKSSKGVNMRFDKELCDKIVSSLPKRKKTNLKEFKNKIKSKTKDLTEIERAFVLFKWIGQNIDYDLKNLNAGKSVDCSKEGVFRTGKTVCSGYSNLYKDIAIYLNLEVKSITCYAKGEGYIPGQKIHVFETNHEINVIKLDGKWYHIDSTWGCWAFKWKCVY